MNENENRITNRQEELFQKMIWNIKDLAEFTEISLPTLYRLTSTRQIPMRKKGGKLYFFPKEILNWIDEGDY